MTDHAAGADRVMTARWPGTCPVCLGLISVGQRIARCGYWIHLEPCYWKHLAIHHTERTAP